jgi:hypothetical protein
MWVNGSTLKFQRKEDVNRDVKFINHYAARIRYWKS